MSLDETHPYHEEYAYATALFFYRADSDYSHISRQLKYHSNIPAGKFFGQQLGARLARAEHLADVDAVIPIPLHWTRKWSRGYNQAEVIAREVATALGVDLRADILERCRRTRTQTKLSIEGKATNVKGAFRVRPDIVQSSGSGTKKADASAISDLKHLLIIDDIFTTGSTALACYSALRDTFPPSVRISIATLGFVGEA
jgi:predicted amidophosphoribosyltransferase